MRGCNIVGHPLQIRTVLRNHERIIIVRLVQSLQAAALMGTRRIAPVDPTVDLRPHDGMIEQGRRRQGLCQSYAIVGVYQDAVGLEAHALEEADQ